MELTDYRKDVLTSCLEALELHIKNQGGQVKSGESFDPYKSSISSTTGQSANKIPVQKTGPLDTYDPSAVQTEIQKLQAERMVSDSLLIS